MAERSQPVAEAAFRGSGGVGGVQAPHPGQGEQLDIEATWRLEVEALDTGATLLRGLAKEFDATPTFDRVDAGSGQFDFRVPADRVNAFLSALGGVGRVLDQTVTAKDVSKELHDDELELQSLDAARRRYEEILSKAQTVAEILSIEHELERIRGAMERTKGTLQWLRDRVARATVHVFLVPRPLTPPPAVFAPVAKFHPGARFVHLLPLGSAAGGQEFGLGMSVHFDRAFALDLDFTSKGGAGAVFSSADHVLFTLGGDFYSDFLGRGENAFLNPYFGLRTGAGWLDGHGAWLFAATAGVELVKTQYVLVDAQTRLTGAFGGPSGVGAFVETSLSAHVAF